MEGSNTSLPRHKQTSRSGTPTLPVEGSKLWHLVRHTALEMVSLIGVLFIHNSALNLILVLSLKR